VGSESEKVLITRSTNAGDGRPALLVSPRPRFGLALGRFMHMAPKGGSMDNAELSCARWRSPVLAAVVVP
jgi:hypothetical protein